MLDLFQETTVSFLPAKLIVVDETDGVILRLIVGDKEYREKDTFPFVALCKMRTTLEKEGQKICCKGSRIDVYPSGSMLIGFNAYILRMGKQALEDDIVDIFEREKDTLLLKTVAEQEERFNKWLKSL